MTGHEAHGSCSGWTDTPEASTPRTPQDTVTTRRNFLRSLGAAGLLGVPALTACSRAAAPPADIIGLRQAIRGRVVLPGEPGFPEVSKPWNLAVTQRVRAVAEIADPADAAALVAFVRRAGLSLSAQPNGHGASDDLDGVVLVRTRRLDSLHVDPDARTARIGAGVTWGQVLAESGPHGLIGLAGSLPSINVTGFTLGGGLSWFGRRYGWAAGSVSAFDLVDPDGRPRRITSASDPDLFWALRGGGGDFGLVTALEFALHPAPALFGGRMTWPADCGPQVMAAFREVTANAPDELTVWMTRMQIPTRPATVGVAVTFLGTEAEARALLAPFDHIAGRVADTRAVLPIAELGTVMSEPSTPEAAISAGEYLTHIDDRTAATLLEPTALVQIQVRHLGGALGRPSDSAVGPIAAPYCVVGTAIARSPGSVEAAKADFADLNSQLSPALAGRRPFNFLAPDDRAAAAFTPDALARLRGIKHSRDPKTVVRSNFPVLA